MRVALFMQDDTCLQTYLQEHPEISSFVQQHDWAMVQLRHHVIHHDTDRHSAGTCKVCELEYLAAIEWTPHPAGFQRTQLQTGLC